MSERATHKFEFSADAIAKAARAEAEYHEGRVEVWRERYETAAAQVRETVSAKVTETEATGGIKHLNVSVDYGDPAAWNEATLAHRKMQEHCNAADRYRTDDRVYRTQDTRLYLLDIDDVHHFRLGGQGREE